MSEEELLRLMRQEPERGAALFMERYLRLIWSIVAGRAGSVAGRAELEDCVSNVVYELYRDMDKIDLSRGSLRGYVAVRARRSAVELYQRCQKERERLGADLPDSAGGPQPEEELLRQEERSALLSAIGGLGETDRAIILRKYFFYQPTKQIARDLHMRPGAVDTRASRALDKLKEMMGGEK